MKYAAVKGYKAARVVLGIGLFGSAYPASEGEKVLDYYVSHGGNVIDTGHIYANWIEGAEKSASEKFLGRYFKAHPGFRDKIILCTKGAHYSFEDPERKPRVKPECISQDVDESLALMGVDYVDFYWLHRDDKDYPVEPIMDTLFAAQDAGKIRHFGASNWTTRRIKAANQYASSCGRDGFFGSQPQLSYVHSLDVSDKTTLYFDEEKDGQLYLDEKLDLFAYTSQAKGYITKVTENIPFKGNMAKNYDCPTNRERAARAVKVAAEIGGCTAEEVGLAFLHTLPYNILTIVGPRLEEQIQRSMIAGEIELTAAQAAYLAKDETPLVRQNL
ncbi:MAG: aldo/keto reductase [Oscillospiraceae bacterium]|jgi:aryl-alcohol dehydrogenase-like predicted oxidoreductase|nr:aldo/keto reductase [Oscillospiraceae bacterium]